MRAAPLYVVNCPLDGINIIEASAGTGKTWNICALYLRLLLERQVEVRKILVVTFTNAATAELRQRVRDRIADTLEYVEGRGGAAADGFLEALVDSLRAQHGLTDSGIASLLRAALQSFDEASIFTIHGFCQRALADTPFAAGMPMSLELLADDSDLVLEVAQDFWRRRIAGGELPAQLTEYLVQRGDSPDGFAELLHRRIRKPLSTVLWPEALDDADTQSKIACEAFDAAYAAARELWLRERDAILACVRKALPGLNKKTYKDASLAQAAREWDELLMEAPLTAGEKLALLTSSELKCRVNKGKQPPEAHPFFDRADELLIARDELQEDLRLQRLRLLRDLLTDGPAAVRRAKRERRVVAFDDMLYNLYDRLTAGAYPGLAATLRARFPVALIDEFQDTDPLQFAIFKSIYGGGGAPLFLVGDPKQAIYSFRNADLHTYLRARDDATADYTLADNQRSTEELIDALNALFAANPNAFMMPGLDYQPVRFGAKPRPPMTDDSEPRAPLQLWTLPTTAGGEALDKSAARREASRACAAEIARLIAAGRRDEIRVGEDALSAGDIAVLVRTHAHGREIRRALSAVGVGSVELSQESVFRSPDAEEIERLLLSIMEPARERLLRAALATEMMGFDAAAINALADDEAKLSSYVERFAEYRDTWQSRGVGVMLRQLFAREGVAERMIGRRDGERRLTNILHLTECLHEAAEDHPAPEMLVRWLKAKRRDDSGDDAEQLRLESDRNLVSVVTIHKAKGLEYRVVFCPFLWDGSLGPMDKSGDGVEYHDENKLPVMDFRGLTDAVEIKARRDSERAAENLRLMYVALTRAVHRCYVVVGTYLSNRSIKECRRGLLNWLVAGEGTPPATWLDKGFEPPAADEAWLELVRANPANIGLAPLPRAAARPADPTQLAPDTLVPLDPPRVPPAWWIGSYTALTHGARHERAAADHDVRTVEPAPPDDRPPVVIDDDDILRFPRGRAAGSCIHEVFEHIDFGDPATWPAAIKGALRASPQAVAGAAAAAMLPRMLERMLRDVLDTPLPGDIRLSGISNRRRLVEMEFTLPSRHLGAAELAGVLRENEYPVPPLAFANLDGYLRGFVDLVFEHDGRFYIVDWKSNHLGDTGAEYTQTALARPMEYHGYHLQYLLYAVALHRYLRQRRPGYSYDDHFGGIFYLFVRGVRPDWRDSDGGATGVYAHRPSLRVVEQIGSLLDAAREVA